MTSSLHAIAKETIQVCGKVWLIKNKEYTIWKIIRKNGENRVVILDEQGHLQDWSSSCFKFIEKA
jgi:hypothetical protein